MNAPVSFAVPQRAKLTARDFWLLAEAGAFRSYRMTELIEGEIWVLNAIHIWHSRTAPRFAYLLTTALRESGSDLEVFSPVSVDLTDDSVPEPDLSIVRYDRTGANGPLAGPDLRIAIEIADSSLEFDLGRKTRLYGSAGVPEYWIVAREGSRIIQQWSPTSDGYAERRDVPFGERLTSETIAGLSVETAPLFD